MKVLVLGGDTFQLFLINRLKVYGYEVHLLGNYADCIAREVADFFHHVDYSNIPEAVKVVKANNIEAVFSSSSDIASHFEYEIQHRCGLPGFNGFNRQVFSSKINYKTILKHEGRDMQPDFLVLKAKELPGYLVGSQKIAKPINGCGSYQIISSVEDYWFHQPTDDSEFLLEDRVYGQEYGGDFIVKNGELLFFCPTKKRSNRFFVPYLHESFDDQVLKKNLEEFVKKLIEVYQIDTGIFNVDLIEQQGAFQLIDLSPRLGGNGLGELSLYAYGIDEIKLYECLLFGTNLPDFSSLYKPTAVYILHADKDGILERVNPLPDNLDIMDYRIKSKPGERVYRFDQGAKHIGYVVFSADTSVELEAKINFVQLYPWINVK